jgi:hypothetical protein
MSSVGTVHFIDFQCFTKKMGRSYGTQKPCLFIPPIEIGGYKIGQAYGFLAAAAGLFWKKY